MRIGIIGGSFNPVHNGHLSIAKAAIDELGLEKMIFMPAFRHPFGEKHYDVSDEDRIAMLLLAIQDLHAAEVSDFEIRKGGTSYTYETLMAFKDMYPGNEIVFVQGTDTFLTLDKWYKFEDLLRDFSFAVGTRPNYRTDELTELIAEFEKKYDSKIYRLKNVEVNVSSTELRERLSEGTALNGLVPGSVEEYISKNGLYRYNQSLYR